MLHNSEFYWFLFLCCGTYLSYYVTTNVYKLLTKQDVLYSIPILIISLFGESILSINGDVGVAEFIVLLILGSMIRTIPISLIFIYVIRYKYLSKNWLMAAFIPVIILSILIGFYAYVDWTFRPIRYAGQILEQLSLSLIMLITLFPIMIFIFSSIKYFFNKYKEINSINPKITFRIPASLDISLTKLAREMERPKTFLIHKAIELYITEMQKDLQDSEIALEISKIPNKKTGYTS